MTKPRPARPAEQGPQGDPAGSQDPKAPPARQCTATSKTTGRRCGHWAMRGGTVCRHHGGAARQVKAKARERQALAAAQADAGRLLAYSSTQAMQDPIEVLGQVAQEALALKDAMAARVNALNEMRYAAPGAGTEQLRVEIQVYERSLDRVVKITEILVRLDFKGPEVELEERKAGIVIAAVRSAVEAANLTEGQRAVFIESFLAGIGRPLATTSPSVVVGQVEQ